MKVTIRRYYGSFAGLRAIFAAVPFVPPLLHACLPDSSAAVPYLYPPLGDAQRIACSGTVGLLLLTTFLVFTCCQLAQKIHPSIPAILMIGFAFGVCASIALYMPYVRVVSVPSVNSEVPVSIGYQRTDFALQTYPQSDDWEMLHDRGPWEEQIQKLWTLRSICVVRVLLWLSYTLALACFLAVVSLAAYHHAGEGALGEPKTTNPGV